MAAAFQCNAAQVGAFFVQNYYKMLQQQPGVTYQFYSDGSSIVRVHGSNCETGTGMMEINSLITSMHVTKIEIKTANFLSSWGNCISVMVSGVMHTKAWSAGRKFAQSFLLAPQDNGFFILTDFLYFDDEEPKQQTAILTPEGCETQIPEPMKSASEFVHEEDYPIKESVFSRNVLDNGSAAEYNYSNPPEQFTQNGSVVDYEYSDTQPEIVQNDTSADYNFSEPQQLVILSDNWGEGAAVSEQGYIRATAIPIQEHTSASFEEAVGEASKKSYASILLTPKGPSAHTDPLGGSTKFVRAAGTHQASQPVSQQSSTGLRNTQDRPSSDVYDGAPSREDEVSLSVYVGNVPTSLSEYDLQNEFKKYGTLIPDGVAIRSRKETGGRYAFVEFEDLTGVHNSLKASPVEIGGWQLYVEERRANGGPAGGKRGRGRPGHQSETMRGGNLIGRNPRKSGTDGASQNNRARGNGYQQRAP